MAMNKTHEIPFGNGDAPPRIEFTLSTGYSVTIDPKAPVESFEHLAGALLGEVFFKDSADTPAWKSRVDATIKEISDVVERVGPDDALAALKVAIWAEFLRMYDKTVRKLASHRKSRRRKRP
jgi:hypothetical protein